MPRVRELLNRFRPAGAPGAASGAGVPVDRRAGVEAELEPVFAALEETQRECARLREDALADASAGDTDAAGRAASIVEQARLDATALRAEAAAEARQHVAKEIAEVGAAAAEQVDEVLRAAQRRRPELVAAVVAVVRAELAGLPGGPARDRAGTAP